MLEMFCTFFIKFIINNELKLFIISNMAVSSFALLMNAYVSNLVSERNLRGRDRGGRHEASAKQK
jgi:hypothetical protein